MRDDDPFAAADRRARIHAERAAAEAQATAPLPVRRLSSASREPIPWHWTGRLPVGLPVLYVGPGGVGKSYSLIDIMARVTTGAPWPNEAPTLQQREPQNVLYMFAEDPESEVRLRAEACDADLDRFYFMDLSSLDHVFSLSAREEDHDRITAIFANTIMETQASVVVLDPIQQFLSGLESDSNAIQLRSALAPVLRACRQTHATVILCHHTNKLPGGASTPEARISGSQAYRSLVRLVMLVDVHSTDNDLVCIDVVKTNLAQRPSMLGFRFEPVQLASADDGEPLWKARCVWESVDGDAGDLGVRPKKQGKAEDRLRELLGEMCAPGGIKPYRDVMAELERELGKAPSNKQMLQAREDLGIMRCTRGGEVFERGDCFLWPARNFF